MVESKLNEQVEPQSIPDGELVTVPEPVPALAIVSIKISSGNMTPAFLTGPYEIAVTGERANAVDTLLNRSAMERKKVANIRRIFI
jgi:hypothetical protein